MRVDGNGRKAWATNESSVHGKIINFIVGPLLFFFFSSCGRLQDSPFAWLEALHALYYVRKKKMTVCIDDAVTRFVCIGLQLRSHFSSFLFEAIIIFFFFWKFLDSHPFGSRIRVCVRIDFRRPLKYISAIWFRWAANRWLGQCIEEHGRFAGDTDWIPQRRNPIRNDADSQSIVVGMRIGYRCFIEIDGY